MSDPNSTTRTGRARLKTIFIRVLVSFSLLALFLFVLLRMALLTPAAAKSVSRALSNYLQQKVTVSALAQSGTSLYIYGATIENPPGFHERHLLSARAISLTPDLKSLLTGVTGLTRLEIDGLKVNLEKNEHGTWNCADIIRRLAGKKARPAREFTIDQLAIRDAAFSLNGQRVNNLGLTIKDFSNKGSNGSRLALVGKDSAGNPFRVVAEGRAGTLPTYHVVLAAPVISLTPIQAFFRGTSSVDFGQAAGRIALSAELHGTSVSVRGTCGVDHVGYHIGGSVIPLKTTLEFASRYDSNTDEATLDKGTVTVNDQLRITGSAVMHRVKRDGSFSLRLTPEAFKIEEVLRPVPEQLLHGVTIAGNLTFREIFLEGTKALGITNGSAALSGREIALSSRERSLLRGGAVDLALQGTATGWNLHGRVFTSGTEANALLENLYAPISARLTKRFIPIRVELPEIKANLMGTALSGSATYAATASKQFTATCTVTGAPTASLNRFLKGTTTQFTGGTIDVAARISGTSPSTFSGRISTELFSTAATISGKRFFLKKAALTSEVHREHNDFSARGRLKTEGGTLDNKTLDTSLDFTVDGSDLLLHDVLSQFDRTSARAATVSVRLPGFSALASQEGFPLNGSFTGIEIRNGDFVASGLDGHIDCHYRASEHNPQLTGIGGISVKSLAYGGHAVASLTGKIAFTGSNATAAIRGDSFGGAVEIVLRVNLFSPERSATFSARLQSQHLDQLGKLLAQSAQFRPAAGTVDASLEGSFSHRQGLRGTLALTGHDMSLANKTGKTLLSGFNSHLDARTEEGNLVLDGLVSSQNEGPSLRIQGQIAHIASLERKGAVNFAMDSTPINSLLDVSVAVLPATLQEAVCEGTCALAGTANLNGRDIMIQANISLNNASLEISSKKLRVADVNGTVPLSLAYPWSSTERKHGNGGFSKENYRRLLDTLQQKRTDARQLNIGTLRFGALETGTMTIHLSADKGVTELSPINVSLYKGKLLGNGYLIIKDRPEFGGNFLLEGLSLTEFCNSFPAIKGYISGRVDGIISLLSGPDGVKGLTGYVNLWTRIGNGEIMLVSREFLQKLAGKKLQGFLFSNDRAYDTGEISAFLRNGFLTFEKLDISHTNFLGMKDLSVSVVPVQNRISLDHLLESIREAAARGKGGAAETPPVQTDLKWLE